MVNVFFFFLDNLIITVSREAYLNLSSSYKEEEIMPLNFNGKISDVFCFVFLFSFLFSPRN